MHACVHTRIRIDKEEYLTVRFEQNQRIYHRVDLRLFSVENYKESRELLCNTNQRPISQYFPRIEPKKNAFYTRLYFNTQNLFSDLPNMWPLLITVIRFV